MRGDEGQYINFTQNLTYGFYSPKDDINLLNGPGYPIVLVPFQLLKIPWSFARLFNSVFLFLAIIYFYKTLQLFLSGKKSLTASYILGIYFPFYVSLIYLSYEIFCIFLICGFIFHFVNALGEEKISNFHTLFSSLFLGYLILSQVVFGYVVLVFIIINLVTYLIKKNFYKKQSLIISVLALIICLPYLIYTYSLTGKFFYWSDSFSTKLYWLSTPYEGEYGDWHHSNHFNLYPKLKENHYDFWNSIKNLNSVERDEALRKKALENISNHPLKFFYNWIANIGRIFFSYPYSYTLQKLSTFFYIIPNMFILFLSLFALYPTLKFRKDFPFGIIQLLIFSIIYLFISSLFSSGVNQFFLVVPLIILWLALVYLKILKIEIHRTMVEIR